MSIDLKGVPGAALVALLLFCSWGLSLPASPAWGWDESMHVQLPAARMLVAAGEGSFDLVSAAFLDCQQYPPMWPMVLACVQAVFGLSEQVARLASLGAWCLTLFGLFLLGLELARAQRSSPLQAERYEGTLAWLLMGFGALSPLCLHYAGTLFLEIPFTLCAVFSLRAWLRRGPRAGRRNLAWREFVAGLWITAACFSKFNYGILLAFGLGLDATCDAWLELRAGRLSEYLRRCAFLILAPAVAIVFWFVLPLPEGFATGAEHRAALAGFLGGNREIAGTPWDQRLLQAAAHGALSVRFFVLLLVCCLYSLREIGRDGVRLMWLVWLAAGLPVWTHNFHLDRFLIPGGPAFWALAALGLVGLLPAAPRPRALVLVGLAALCFLAPGRDAPWLAERLGLLSHEPAVRAHQERALAGWSRLAARRPLPTAGASRRLHDGLLSLAAAEAGPKERVGWLGTSSEMAPAAIQLGLFFAGGSRQRFLRDATREMDITFAARDPEWSLGRLSTFADGFDLLFATDPVDLGGRTGRAFVADYSRRLVEDLGWRIKRLGLVQDDSGSAPISRIYLYALRPPK
ncbi:MAG: hypothetical protein ABGY71_06160 [bacterium]|jgi:hypothetical protein|nr:hypothetical protein [Planctomycetota bacterium]HIL51360.1 hypothetical protein [Planctomycetota bacterium]